MPQPYVKKVQKALQTVMEAAQDRHFNQLMLLRAYADLVKTSEATWNTQVGKKSPATEDKPC